MKLVIDYAVYVAVRLFVCVIQALPLELCHEIARRLAWLLGDVLKVRGKVVDDNLRTAFPEASAAERARIVRGMWEHLLLMLAEIAQTPRKVHRTNWREHGSMPRMAEMTRMLLDERPLVIISGHLGNFEMGGYQMGLHGFPTHTVARPLDNRFLHDFVNRFRGATGQHMLPKDGSGPEITELMRRGGTLVLLGDQNAGPTGCWVEFFGRPASTHKAVSIFTLGSDAPTCFCGMVRTGGPLEIEGRVTSIVDPLDDGFALKTVTDVAQWYTTELEGQIREYPEQYWWLHRRWREDQLDRRALRRLRKQARAA